MPAPTDPYDDMPIDDTRVPDDTYREFVSRMPQVCVEVVLVTEEGILLAERKNHPRVWFWPGGRLYKGETVEAAARRIATDELGIEVELGESFGPYAHFWRGERDEPSRHTVNVPFLATPRHGAFEISLDDQHGDYRFVDSVEPWMHRYVRRYLEELPLR
jgi:colanic acid biosynthesis protein WcaH